MIQVLAVVAAAGATYFLVMWVWSLSAHRQMTSIERTNAEIEEARRLEDRESVTQRAGTWLHRRGYYGSLAPLLVGWCFGYLLVLAALMMFGVNPLFGLLVGAPLTFAVTFAALAGAQSRRRRTFNHQLLQMFDMVASQVEAGSGTNRAFELVVPALRDPLRSEMVKVLEATATSKKLVDAIRDLEQEWPSRAMAMFVSALELNEEAGAPLAPALRQASSIIQRNEELVDEAQAELAQTRMEFYVVAGVIAFLAAWMVLGGDDQTRAAFFSPIGLIGLLLCIGNYCWGLFRAWRLFTRVKEIM